MVHRAPVYHARGAGASCLEGGVKLSPAHLSLEAAKERFDASLQRGILLTRLPLIEYSSERTFCRSVSLCEALGCAERRGPSLEVIEAEERREGVNRITPALSRERSSDRESDLTLAVIAAGPEHDHRPGALETTEDLNAGEAKGEGRAGALERRSDELNGARRYGALKLRRDRGEGLGGTLLESSFAAPKEVVPEELLCDREEAQLSDAL